MSQQDPEKLLDQVITYLKNQQEIFGDFDVNASMQSRASAPDPVEKSVPEERTIDKKSPAETSAPDAEPVRSTSPAPAAESQPAPASGEQTPTTVTSSSASADNLFREGGSENVYDQLSGCQSLEELKTLCARADVLHTDLDGTNLVFGVGNPQADLMIIGEAPGEQEDRQGEPFVGKAGQLLNKILAAINFSRDDVYIANILKHRPPNNRNPLPEERKRSLPFLMKQIELVNPKLILCLGRVSANTLLDNDQSLKNMRGRFITYRDQYLLMVTYHPAALLRNPNWKRPAWEDVQLLREKYDELGCKP